MAYEADISRANPACFLPQATACLIWTSGKDIWALLISGTFDYSA